MRLEISIIARFFACLCLIAPQLSAAQTYAEQIDAAITLINAFIAENCQRPTGKGGQTHISVDAKVEGKLKGLTTLVAEVGGDVGANAERTQWDGVDQSDMAEAMAAGNKCSVEMTKLVLPHFFPPRPKDLMQPGGEDDGAVQIGVTKERYGVRSGSEKFLVWEKGISATADDCLRKLSYAGGECRGVPQHLYCSYEYNPNFPVRPLCFWMAEDCETYFGGSAMSAPHPSYRIGCQRIPSSQALAQYETLESECDKLDKAFVPTPDRRLKPPRSWICRALYDR